jgi:hypothetical protein
MEESMDDEIEDDVEEMVPCPACRELVSTQAIVCPNCRTSLVWEDGFRVNTNLLDRTNKAATGCLVFSVILLLITIVVGLSPH